MDDIEEIKIENGQLGTKQISKLQLIYRTAINYNLIQ